jgi:hypothetical protein
MVRSASSSGAAVLWRHVVESVYLGDSCSMRAGWSLFDVRRRPSQLRVSRYGAALGEVLVVRRGPSQLRVSRYGAALVVDGGGCEKGSIAAESEQVRGCVGRWCWW